MIEAEGLTKFYGALPAIRDVSFQVQKGEVVGFLGLNGAGKSTTMRILTCYMPPSAGTARIDGLDCFEKSLEVRRRIGYLPENVPLYSDLTVRRMLRFAAEAKGVEAGRIENEISRVIDICGLGKVDRRIIGNLSKGYKQRVGLAQALINNPAILILDEPTIGLDPTQIIEIRKLILSLREEHTILLSSHILPEVAQICRRVIIINRGRIVATDAPTRLTDGWRGSAEIVIEVRDGGSELAPVLERMAGIISVAFQGDSHDRLILQTDPARDIRPEIARAVIERNAGLLEMRRVEPSLEDIFVHLVAEDSAEESAPPPADSPQTPEAQETKRSEGWEGEDVQG